MVERVTLWIILIRWNPISHSLKGGLYIQPQARRLCLFFMVSNITIVVQLTVLLLLIPLMKPSKSEAAAVLIHLHATFEKSFLPTGFSPRSKISTRDNKVYLLKWRSGSPWISIRRTSYIARIYSIHQGHQFWLIRRKCSQEHLQCAFCLKYPRDED